MRRLKRLELAWRRACLRGVTAAMRWRAGGTAHLPPFGERPVRVLFLRPDRIGDMVVSTGLLRAVAASHPGIELDVLASPANAPVVRDDPHVRSVLVMDKKRPRSHARLAAELRRGRYDVVLDCMVTAPSLTTVLLMLATGAPWRVGIAGRGVDEALTVAVPRPPEREGRGHIIDLLALLGEPFGIDAERTDWRPHLSLDPGHRAGAERVWTAAVAPERPRRLLVNVSAGNAARTWADERFVEVIRGVRARFPEWTVVVIGAPAETDRVERVRGEAGVVSARTATFKDAAALVGSADALFSPDTSIVHAAAAFRVPSVSMYLFGAAGQWRPYRSPGVVLESRDPVRLAVGVGEAAEALEGVLGAVEQRRDPGEDRRLATG